MLFFFSQIIILTSPVLNAISSVAKPKSLARGTIAKKFIIKVMVGDQTKCEAIPIGTKTSKTLIQDDFTITMAPSLAEICFVAFLLFTLDLLEEWLVFVVLESNNDLCWVF